MKPASRMVAAAIAVCLASAAQAATVRHHHIRPNAKQTPAAAQSFEVRYRACRTEAFRRFGWHYGTRLVLYRNFAVEQVDFCVRNGGHF
jgi:opacity protein-like surface antigen